MNYIDNILLNIPHSSNLMPINTWKGNINKEIEKWTDWYTNEIFFTTLPKVNSVIFPYSRFFCDVERLINDPLEKDGQGIFYTKFGNCERSEDEDLKKIVMDLWQTHQDMLKHYINKNTLLIDCHSFPAEMNNEVDICIGWNEDWSKPSTELIDKIKNYFEEMGYRVGLNNPYSNSITPDKSEIKYSSLMIEINKATYTSPSDFYQKMEYLYLNILYKWNY